MDGQYVDMYERTQQLKDPASPIYGCDAFWNTFWNLNQLWALATPDIMNKWVESFIGVLQSWVDGYPMDLREWSIVILWESA